MTEDAIVRLFETYGVPFICFVMLCIIWIDNKRKINKEDINLEVLVSSEKCEGHRNKIQEEFKAGSNDFTEIKTTLKNMAEKFTNFYDHNDKQNIRMLEEIGGKKGIKERLLSLEIKFDEYKKRNK